MIDKRDYLIICRAIKYQHLGLVDYYINLEWEQIPSKHKLWLMKFLNKHGMIWNNRK